MPLQVPDVQSFIIRFIENRVEADGILGPPDWRGVIIHIQTNEEKGFSDFAEAVAFIAHHVCIGDVVFRGGDDE